MSMAYLTAVLEGSFPNFNLTTFKKKAAFTIYITLLIDKFVRQKCGCFDRQVKILKCG